MLFAWTRILSWAKTGQAPISTMLKFSFRREKEKEFVSFERFILFLSLANWNAFCCVNKTLRPPCYTGIETMPTSVTKCGQKLARHIWTDTWSVTLALIRLVRAPCYFFFGPQWKLNNVLPTSPLLLYKCKYSVFPVGNPHKQLCVRSTPPISLCNHCFISQVGCQMFMY